VTSNRFSRVGLLAVVLVAVLTACQQVDENAPVPAAPASNSPAETSTASDVDPLETVTVVEVGPESLDLVDADGATVMALSYDDAVDGVVKALTIVLASEPAVTPEDGGLESPAFVRYEWAGFELQDAQPEAGSFTDISNYLVSVTVAAQDDVSFVTPAGSRIGDDLRTQAQHGGVEVDETFASMDQLFYFELGPELSTKPGENPTNPNARAVTLSSSTPSGVIDKIVASSNPSFSVQ